ncbi:ATP-grasp domain-containing protein [Micromonospora radicis]|uniref:ATP-grasp domain-containing protein n=1 Tax=Micromonospora radicis TaxID=1894971 RepID=A0A418MZV1_9ACTN|nr:hypothetical protein [Micromonospora radicis]RIV40339.1 hypothetical protein D2L64_05740 [Micromonospora radicis]
MPGPIELVVPNNGEFNVRNQTVDLGPRGTGDYLDFGTYLADQAVFWSRADRVLLLPAGYDPLWFADVHGALGLAPPTVVSPQPRSNRLLSDLLHDAAALSALRRALGGRPVRLLSWGATPELFLLAESIRSWGQRVEVDGVTRDNDWTSRYLDSKLGCLDLARDLGIATPRSITVIDRDELRGALAVTLRRHPRAIVKSPYGVGGQGSAVVDADDESTADFWDRMHDDPYLRAYPLIVQEFVAHAPGLGCPALDFRVDDDGVCDLALSAVTTAQGHLFQSVNVGVGSLPTEVADRIVPLGRRIGAAAGALGFRGWLCVDLIAGADGEIYLAEINARRSGAMHSIGLLSSVRWGRDVTLSSHDLSRVRGPGPVSYRDRVRPAFQRAWAAGRRVYPTAVRGLSSAEPMLALVAAGSTAAEAEAIVRDVLAEIDEPAPSTAGPAGRTPGTGG